MHLLFFLAGAANQTKNLQIWNVVKKITFIICKGKKYVFSRIALLSLSLDLCKENKLNAADVVWLGLINLCSKPPANAVSLPIDLTLLKE